MLESESLWRMLSTLEFTRFTVSVKTIPFIEASTCEFPMRKKITNNSYVTIQLLTEHFWKTLSPTSCPVKTLLHLLPGYRSFSHPVRAARSASPSSLQTVHRRSPEGCGAPGLEKAPIDGGNSQEAPCLWSLTQSALFKTLFLPSTDAGWTWRHSVEARESLDMTRST